MKLWAKIISGDHMLANQVFVNHEPMDREAYEAFLMEICHTLDLSTPITLRMHYQHLSKFNIVQYLPRDFVEPVDFDKFILENVDYD